MGEGNIHLHSQKEERYRCNVCGQTFSATKGTLFYRLRTDPTVVVTVLTLLAYGCPIEAIVAAYQFDKRTVKAWWRRAGAQCKTVHHHLLEDAQLDIQQAQADELKIKMWGRSVWMGFSMMVSTRLWLGGVVSEKRDKKMIEEVIACIRRVALCRSLLIAVDGLPHYVNVIKRQFRTPLPSSKGGRPRLIVWSTVMIGRVIKRRCDGELTIERQLHNGATADAVQLIKQTQGKAGVLNTAFIERLNGTFRQRLSWLKRRSRHLAHQIETLSSGMFIVGSIYNLCETHHALRCKLHLSAGSYRWIHRTPALVAGLTDHVWTVQELLSFRVPPPRWTPPKKRGRRSQEQKRLIKRWG